MKFFKETVAAALLVLSSCSSVEAKLTASQVQDRIKEGKFDKQRLLKHAIPYNTYLRSLEQQAEEGDAEQEGVDYENYDNYYEEEYGDNPVEYEDYPRVAATAATKLQFNQCLSVKTENYNLMFDNIYEYAQAGTISSIRNFVLFDVCINEKCRRQNNNANVYMVDLTTFIEAVVAYGPVEKEAVCYACQTYAYVCGRGDEEYEENDGNWYNGGGRKLQDGNYHLFDKSMCDSCDTYNCWYDDEGDNQEDFDSIEQWVSQIAECQQANGQWQGLSLFSGWMCNQDGSGIEVGVFIDQYCRMYNNKLAFTDYMQDYDYQYYYQSQDVIPYMFSSVIGCDDVSTRQYVDSETYSSIVSSYEPDDDTDYQEDYEDSYYQLNNACENLFYSNYVPRSLGDCGDQQTSMQTSSQEDISAYYQQQQQNQQQNSQNQQWGNGYNANNNNGQDGQNGQQQNGQSMYEYVSQTQAQQMLYNTYGHGDGDYQYDLQYDVSVHDLLDGAATCDAVAKKFNGKKASNVYSGGNAFWKYVGGGGNMFSRNGDSFFQTANARLSPVEITLIVIGSIVGTAFLMNYTRKQVIKRKIKKEPVDVYVRATDDKDSPLIIS